MIGTSLFLRIITQKFAAIFLILTLFIPATHAFSPLDRMLLSDNGKVTDAPIYMLDGKKVRLSDYRGKYVLLTFWATWCRACASEMPYLEKLAQQFTHDDIVFLAVTRSYPSQTTETVSKFRRQNGLMTLQFGEDSNGKETQAQLHTNFNISSLPSAVIIDPRGHYIGRFDGAVQWNHKDFIKFFQDLLDGKINPTHKKTEKDGSWLDTIKGFFS